MSNFPMSLIAGLLGGLKSSSNDIEKRTIQINSETFHYQVHLPAELKGKKNLPVIVFLHGIRERGTGGFLPESGSAAAIASHYLKKVPAIIVLPQCRPGKYWSDSLMEQMVMKSLEQTVTEFGADKSRIYLAGVSMGGYGVWHFASRFAETFAALVAICGGSPLLTGERFAPIAKQIGSTPVWVFHGEQDRIVPVSESRSMVNAIREHGGSVKYNEYEKVGHEVWLNALKEKQLLPWLLSQNN